MRFQIRLDGKIIKKGDLKSLTVLFNSLNGSSFALNKTANWINKMSATESYKTYLRIVAQELDVESWTGQLSLCHEDGSVERVHLFETHQSILEKQIETDLSSSSSDIQQDKSA